MKTVTWTDANQRKHRSLLPEQVPDSHAPQGIPQDPPPFMELLDWEGMGRNLWNMLVEAGIYDWQTHQANPQLMSQFVRQAITIPLINLYKAETRNRPAPNGE